MTKGINKKQLQGTFEPYIKSAFDEGFTHSFIDGLRGSYSSVWGAHLHLSNDDENIVMWMERDRYESDWSAYGVWEIKCYVARFTCDDVDMDYTWPSDWKEHLVHEETWVEVDENWFVAPEDADAVCKLRRARKRARRHECERYFDVTNEALRIVRKLPGFKTVKGDNVRIARCGFEENDVRYIVRNIKSNHGVILTVNGRRCH